jgi:iron complex outermembrane receptor protein
LIYKSKTAVDRLNNIIHVLIAQIDHAEENGAHREESMKYELKATAAMSALLVLGGGALHAQSPDSPAALDQIAEPAEEQGRVLETVLVTANKREEASTDIGASITALDGEQLSDKQFTSPADLARLVPGFSYTESDVNVPVYTLRGIGFNETSVAASPTVSVYVDEIALPYPIMTKGAAFDLQRVEVLKGPQGTLYGRNTTGGAINYIANKPTDTLEAGYSVGYGNYNALSAEMFVSGPLTDNIRTRIATTLNRADGWQKSQTRPGDTHGIVDQLAGRATLEWDISPDVLLTLSVNGWVDTGDTAAPQLFAIAPTTPARALPVVLNSPVVTDGSIRLADWDPDVDFARDDDFIQLAGRLDWNLTTDITLTSITSNAILASTSVNERDGMASNNSSYTSNSGIRAFSQELRLAGTDPFASWVVGVNYSNDETKDRNIIDVKTLSQVQASQLVQVGNYGNTEIESSAVFGSIDWALADALTLTTGVRYSSTTQDFNGCSFDSGDGVSANFFRGLSATLRNSVLRQPPLPAGTFRPNGCYTLDQTFAPNPVTDSLTEDNISWRAGLNYKPLDTLLLYGSVSQGYKGGNFPTVSASSTRQYAAALEESLLSYETGAKLTLLDGTMQMNLAGFYYDYKDKQVRGRIQDPVFSTLQRLVNIPESHALGAEFDILWIPLDGLTLNSSVAWTQTEIDEYVGFDQFGAIRDFTGSPFSYSPELQFNVGADYEWELGASGLIGFAGGDYAYRSDTSGDFGVDPRFAIDEYGLLALRAGVKTDDWKLMFWGQNVTNEYYWNNALRAATDGIVRYVGKPATYGIRFTHTFQ